MFSEFQSHIGFFFAVMMPLWMWALGSHFLRGNYAGVHIKMPYGKIVTSLFTMIVPLLCGVILSRWKPVVQTKARKVGFFFLFFSFNFLNTMQNFSTRIKVVF